MRQGFIQRIYLLTSFLLAASCVPASANLPINTELPVVSTTMALPSRTPNPTASQTSFPSATNSPGPTKTPAPTLPAKAVIEGIQGSYQQYALSCEANAAAQLARYFGLALTQREFQEALPLSKNPETGFVGQVQGDWGAVPPASYGVHAPPVAALLREYGLNARAQSGLSMEDIRQEIAAGRPVMVWVIGGVRTGRPVLFTAPDGSVVTVAAYQHTVLVIGYGPDYFTILDGKQEYHRSINQFSESWKVLGNMAVTVAAPVLLPELD